MLKIIGVMLADDRPLMRAGIRASLTAESDLMLLGEATESSEVRCLCQKIQPGVLLLAWSIAKSSLIEMLIDLHQHCPATKTLVLSDGCSGDCRTCIPWIIASVGHGCLHKDGTPEAVMLAIRNAMQGVISLSRPVVEKLIQQGAAPALAGEACLTKRELEVLLLITRGLSNKEIALKLGITVRTVEFHVGHILEKLGMVSRVEAAVWAKEHYLM